MAVCDLAEGVSRWVDLEALDPSQAATILEAAARFPGGWGPAVDVGRTPPELLWGGAGAIPPDDLPGTMGWDVVCGFPVPAVPRPGGSPASGRRCSVETSCRSVHLVSGWLSRNVDGFRLVAPSEDDLRLASGRPDAELGVEYPLPWERNGELCGVLVRMGEAAAARVLVSGSD